MRQMGINAIRIWFWHEKVDHTAFLDLAFNRGIQPIYVFLTFNPDFGYPKYTFDITDARPSVWRNIEGRFRVEIKKYQHHPAILAWCIGQCVNVHVYVCVCGGWGLEVLHIALLMV